MHLGLHACLLLLTLTWEGGGEEREREIDLSERETRWLIASQALTGARDRNCN